MIRKKFPNKLVIKGLTYIKVSYRNNSKNVCVLCDLNIVCNKILHKFSESLCDLYKSNKGNEFFKKV